MHNYTLEYELDTQSEGFQTAKKESSNYYSRVRLVVVCIREYSSRYSSTTSVCIVERVSILL